MAKSKQQIINELESLASSRLKILNEQGRIIKKLNVKIDRLIVEIKNSEAELLDYELIKNNYGNFVKIMLWAIKENPDLSKP